MPITVTCECGKTLRAPDTAAGKKAKCPQCGTVVKLPQAEVEDYDRDDDDNDDDDAEDYDEKPRAAVKKRSKRPCPMCGEPISADATECPHCDEELDAPRKKLGKSGRKKSARRAELAGPLKRLLGVLADGVAGVVFILPGLALMIVGISTAKDNDQFPAGLVFGILLLALGVLGLLGVQIYLLVTRSQSIGKYLVKTQILDYETNEPADIVKTILLRNVVNSIIGAVPIVGVFYSLVDPLFVFSEEHRCLHDRIAGTYVVDISEEE